jgi:hypothetical protein
MNPAFICPSGPDEYGDWPCERGPNDECLTCGWQPQNSTLPSFAIAGTQRPLPPGISLNEWPPPFRACPPRGISQR